MADLPLLASMSNKTPTVVQARRFLLFLSLALLLSILTSFYFDMRGLDSEYRSLAAEMGRSFYQAIDSVREWNLKQGGIYVRQSDSAVPNPYLRDPMRDLSTADGMKLTMVNHAQMTRLLSELLSHERGIHLHIAGLEPLRPDNQPDDWERHALTRFEDGNKEEFAVVGKGETSIFRYMAPLRTGPSCASCHTPDGQARQNVFGGVSVSFSYAPFLKVMAAERRQILILHALFLGLGFGVIALTGGKLISGIAALQSSIRRIKRLEGLLPICAQCKKVRLEGAEWARQDSWVAIERYIEDHTDTEFTHGLCPACAHQLYPTVFKDKTQ
ncbi:MAG: DUF3365 domain-containing protein [Acidobacteriia bacterium]|nr:DUF3365 domain-containing protein [Terriglobia bacterium]